MIESLAENAVIAFTLGIRCYSYRNQRSANLFMVSSFNCCNENGAIVLNVIHIVDCGIQI